MGEWGIEYTNGRSRSGSRVREQMIRSASKPGLALTLSASLRLDRVATNGSPNGQLAERFLNDRHGHSCR